MTTSFCDVIWRCVKQWQSQAKTRSLWPPNSPDLNPVGFKIWGVLEERVYSKGKLCDVAHLRERLVHEWAKFDQAIIDRAVGQWRRRLQACVEVGGGLFEHKF